MRHGVQKGAAMDWDDAYANGAYIAGAADYPPRWADRAAEWRAMESAVGRADLNVPYGEGDRERFDLFYPAGRPEGLVIFVHGGYWRAFGRETWSHLAAGACARGWAVAMPSYTLAPQARIAQITAQVARAAGVAAGRVAGPVVLTGHSAGGHLVARLAEPGIAPALEGRIARVVPISPLSDLRPLLNLSMNADWQMDAAEAEEESPALHPAPGVPVHVWVGGDERPSFLDQARWLSEAWGAGLTVEPGRHHFDVIDGLADEGSALMRTLLPQG